MSPRRNSDVAVARPADPSLLRLELEDGWMLLELAPALAGRLELSLRGVHGARGSRFDQHAELGADERVKLAAALLEGTTHKVMLR